MVNRPVELVVSLGLVAVAVAALVASFDGGGGVNAASTDSPMRLPRILLGIWIAFGLACAIRAAVLAEKVAPVRPKGWAIALMAMLVSLIAGLLPVLGYLVPVTIGLAGLLYILGERNPVRGGAALLLLGPGLWFLFHHVLGLRLPVLLSGGAF